MAHSIARMSWLASAILGACQIAVAAAAADAPPVAWPPSTTVVQPDHDARRLAGWVVAAHDSAGRPFLVVDKRNATVSAFDAAGRLLGSAPALLGAAQGDDSVPGIGERAIADIQPHERTTPAGRFAAEMGANSGGEDILWVDYDAAVSLHRMRPVKASDRRRERLASATPDDNRITYGCINVPAPFFDAVVKPLFMPRNGVVYVLPDSKPVAVVFAAAFAGRTAQR